MEDTVFACNPHRLIADCENTPFDQRPAPAKSEDRANAEFIAFAFNVAHRLDSLGYDGEACLSRLPEILEALQIAWDYRGKATDRPASVDKQIRDLLSTLKPSV